MTASANASLSEQAITHLEGQIPSVAEGATRAAYVRALAAGHTVLKVEGAYIVASQADGSTRVVGDVKPRRKVTVGASLKVRRMDAGPSA
ncbi:hypothetical protein [Pseudomonas capsici]|uniref:hypothetical protein n=1 Tax=Pseudomonas capsici TaxID=2810614 RepID=UPI000EFF80FB|nr:hypothetical protein [Pseudomonas capsici]MCV4265709.1 hypothetical protein [Pseudomonas capsici]